MLQRLSTVHQPAGLSVKVVLEGARSRCLSKASSR